MIKAIFLVPIRDNHGDGFSTADWRTLERRLLEFGGFTCARGVSGAWEHEGRVYRDSSRRYEVALEDWGRLHGWLEAVRWVRWHFRQEAIYIEVAGIPEVLD